MAHFDEGVGEARNVFSTNLARILNVYGLVERSLVQEAKTAEAALEGAEQDAREIRERGWRVIGRPLQAIDMPTFFRDQRELSLGSLGAGCEMAFVYLIAIFDSFFGQWRVEVGLDRHEDDDKAPSASPKNIMAAIRELHIARDLLPVAVEKLTELRERRNALTHKGGIADRRYCEATGQWDHLDKRLDVDQGYLYVAVDFVDHLAATLAILGHKGDFVHYTNEIHRQNIVSRMFTPEDS